MATQTSNSRLAWCLSLTLFLLASNPGALATAHLKVCDYTLPEDPSEVLSIDIDLTQGAEVVTVPTEIGRATKLQYFRIRNPGSYATIASFPTEIGLVRSLEGLALVRTGLQELPTEIGDLNSLKSFFVGANPLQELPTQIGRLEALEDFRARQCPFISLPTEIGNMASLGRLEFEDSELTEVPFDLWRLNLATVRFDPATPGLKLPANHFKVLVAPSANVVEMTGDELIGYAIDHMQDKRMELEDEVEVIRGVIDEVVQNYTADLHDAQVAINTGQKNIAATDLLFERAESMRTIAYTFAGFGTVLALSGGLATFLVFRNKPYVAQTKVLEDK